MRSAYWHQPSPTVSPETSGESEPELMRQDKFFGI